MFRHPGSLRTLAIPLCLALVAGCTSGGEGDGPSGPGVLVATQLVLVTPAAGAASGLAFATQPVVALRTASGQTVVTDNGSLVTVTVGSAGTPGALVGATTVQALGGVVHFTNLGISGAAGTSYTLTFSRDGLAPVTQTITPTPGTAAALRIRTAAAGAPSGGAFTTQPAVEVIDAAGNVVTTATNPVTLGVSASATTVGTTTAVAASGVATFATAGISGVAGTNYTLTYSATGLTPATQPITPVPGALATITIAPDTTTLLLAQQQTLAPVGRDAAGNVIPGVTYAWTTSNGAVATVSGAGVVTASATGQATITATSGARSAQLRVGVIAFVDIADGFGYLCARTTTGVVYCWGSNEYGGLGDGTFLSRTSARPTQGGFTFATIRSGVHYSCGVTTSGEGRCWGRNAAYILGDSTTINRGSPTLIRGGLDFRSIDVGNWRSCGVTTTNHAYCWGDGSVMVPALKSSTVTFSTVTVGYQHACGRSTSNQVLCWGSNTIGQLGDTNFFGREEPAPLFTPMNASEVVSGGYHTCAIRADGPTYCWGINDFGQLGQPPSQFMRTPVLVPGGHSFVSLSANRYHTCGLTSDGSAYCWGDSSDGRLGIAPNGAIATPVAVPGGLHFTRIAALVVSTCGVATDGVMYCWGRVNGSSPVPTPLRLP